MKRYSGRSRKEMWHVEVGETGERTMRFPVDSFNNAVNRALSIYASKVFGPRNPSYEPGISPSVGTAFSFPSARGEASIAILAPERWPSQ